MAQINFDPLKYLGHLPEFDGDGRELQNFINLIDRIHPNLQSYDELSQGLFSDLIKSKLKGKARDIIEINFQAISWTDIKLVLQNNFGDRLSCDELFDSLRAVTFKTTSLEFYEEIKDKLRRLNNKTLFVMGQGQQQETLNAVATNNSRTALNIFKSKIPEPMKTILACRNPTTLESAMNILFEAGYAHLRVDMQQQFYDRHEHKKQNQKTNNYARNHQGSRHFSQPSQNQGRNPSYQNNYQGPRHFSQPFQNQGRNPSHQNNYQGPRHFSQPLQNQGKNPSYQNHEMNFPSQSSQVRFSQPFPNYDQNFQQQRTYPQTNRQHQNPQNTHFNLNRPSFRNQVEPMDIGKIEVAENFQELASGTNYHL